MNNIMNFERFVKRSKGKEHLKRNNILRIANRYGYDFKTSLKKFKGIEFCIWCGRPTNKISIAGICKPCTSGMFLSPVINNLIEAI